VLGAFQVAATATWPTGSTGAPDAIPAVGGAMDLAIGARQTWVMMEHRTKAGAPKLVPALSYPVTGLACVSRVYTELAVMRLQGGQARVLALCPGLTLQALQAMTPVPLHAA
jgi:3-oxoadipate CoA-transferase beta subunit